MTSFIAIMIFITLFVAMMIIGSISTPKKKPRVKKEEKEAIEKLEEKHK